MWCDSQVSPEALSVSVLMQPKTSSDAHLTPCACHKAGQGQLLPGTASATFAWTKSTSLSHFFQPRCQSCFLSSGASQTEITPTWCSLRQCLHLHRPQEKARKTTAFSTNPFLEQANLCSPLQVSTGKWSN